MRRRDEISSHEIVHRYDSWYLELTRRCICETSICRLSLSQRREFNALTINIWIHSIFHRYLRSLISHCDLIASISMWFDCRRFRRLSTKWEKWKMIEKSIRKEMHRMRDRLLRAYIDAMSANSSVSILTKICQRIKSISMRKDSIFSTLFVLLDRTLALRDRNVIWLHCTLLRNDIIWHQVLVVFNTLSRSDIDSTSRRTRDCIVRFFEAILSDCESWRIDCTLSRSCIVRYDVKSL